MIHIVKSWVGIIRINGVGVKYGFILGLKKLLLLNSISQTITNKKEKQTTKKIKSNQNKAYTKVDLDLDDS